MNVKTIIELIELREQQELKALIKVNKVVYYYLSGEDILSGFCHAISENELDILSTKYNHSPEY